LTALASSVASNWATNLGPLATVSVALTQVECIDLQNPSTIAGFWAGNHTGTRSPPDLTAETCVLINNHIARRYRGGKPRVYLPYGAANDLVSPQNWIGGFISGMQSAWNAFLAGITSFPGPPALSGQVAVSYFHGSTWHQNSVTGAWKRVATQRATPLVDAVTSSTVNIKPGSQRRRMLR
jgi:hypothetical protein